MDDGHDSYDTAHTIAGRSERTPHAACHKLHAALGKQISAYICMYAERKSHKRFGIECDDLKAKLIIMRIGSSKIDRYNKAKGIN